MNQKNTNQPVVVHGLEELENQSRSLLRDFLSSGFLRVLLSILSAFALALLFIIFTNTSVLSTLDRFFAAPGDFFIAAGNVVVSFFVALFKGSIYNFDASSFDRAIRPLTETLRFAGPLVAAGLGIALSFKVGLFNIGGQGQILAGAAFAGYVSFQVELPVVLHLLAALAAGLLGAAIWGGIVGILKSTTGAHEVIVTIMLNYIAVALITYLMRTEILNPGLVNSNPATPPPGPNAQLPTLLGSGFNLHLGFALALLAVLLYWWLMERSSIGYKFKAVGLNPAAAESAGISPKRIYIIAMAASGAFVGIAAVNQALGRTGGFSPSVDQGIGFDAITVALLGQGSPIGILFAGILFGAFKAADQVMQQIGVTPDILKVVQALSVLFVAAPLLVKNFFRLPGAEKKVKPETPSKSDAKDVAESGEEGNDKKGVKS